jgi:hypothetical protein
MLYVKANILVIHTKLNGILFWRYWWRNIPVLTGIGMPYPKILALHLFSLITILSILGIGMKYPLIKASHHLLLRGTLGNVGIGPI